MTAPRRPGCMSDDEWALWSAGQAQIRWPSLRVHTPCFDCVAPFFREMRLAGRCDGFPGQRSAEADTPQRMAWRNAARRHAERVA